MRLVLITQRVNASDPVLAATVPKIQALAARVDELVVLAQSGRSDGLSPNVELRTFGSQVRLGRGWKFEREVTRALPADAVIAHMVPLYVILAAPIVRARRTPILLWYTHWHRSLRLRAAERLATAIVSVDRRSFPLKSSKVRAIGHGIDLKEFPCTSREPSESLRALVLGRYSGAKGLPTILDGVRLAQSLGLEVSLEVRGPATTRPERLNRFFLQAWRFRLDGPIHRGGVPELFSRTDVLVNNMRAGAPDKVVYEAAASCLPVVASNPVFDELFDGFPLSFEQDDARSLAQRLLWFASLSPEERTEIGRVLRERVARRHSVETWADGILAAVRR